MVQPELLAYIKENTGKFEKTAIVEALVATGWSLGDINAAFLELQPSVVKPSIKPAAQPVTLSPVTAVQQGGFASGTPVVPPSQPTPVLESDAVVISPDPTPVATPVATVMPKQNVVPPQTLQGDAENIVSQIPTQTNQNAAFLAEMQRHRREAAALNPNKIVDGDVEVSIGATAQPAAPQEGITGMLIKTGLVKNEQQANIFMIVSAIIMLGIAAWFTL